MLTQEFGGLKEGEVEINRGAKLSWERSSSNKKHP